MSSTLLESPLSAAITAPQVHRFPNGLTIVAEQVPVDAVNLSLWLDVGSTTETDDINGIAHFLEHMIFKGTQRLRSGEFERWVEERGAVMNAGTSQDYTHYYITTAPKDFAALAPYQIEVVLNAAIPDDAFARERLVVLEEIRRALDNPRRRNFYRSMQMAFDRLPYRRPVLGQAEVIEQLTAAQMRHFHTTWYQPSRMTAVVVGNLPVDELVQIVTDGFERAIAHRTLPPPSAVPTPPTYSAEPAFTVPVRREYTDAALQQARLVMLWRVPGLNDLARTFPMDVLAAILGRGRTARLVRDLREDRQLVTAIGVSNSSYRHQGLFYISAELPVENLETVEAAIAQHIAQIQAEPVTPEEVQRIKTLTAHRFLFANEAPGDRAGLYGFYQSLVQDLDMALHYPDRIKAMQPEDIQHAAQTLLSPDHYAIATFCPEPA